MLRRFAVHAETGEPMPEALLDKVLAARTFNQGFATVEYTASALVDLDLHLLPTTDDVDVVAFEKAALERIGMPETIVMRHRTPHFGHIFSGDGYAAGYYSYLWSEVLDADAFEAFARGRRHLRSGDGASGFTTSSIRPATGAIRPRPTPPSAAACRRPEALLRKRGLDELIRNFRIQS